MSEHLQIDAANVMHEIIEGEVVIVNLQLGTYYSLDAVGADIWTQLTGGRTRDALIADVMSRYGGDRDQVAAGIDTFLQELRNEKLITTAPGDDDPPRSSSAPAASMGAYSDPVLQKYSDMEQLLLVDPIHEVEDSGWPDVK